jgi:hypothetical protein
MVTYLRIKLIESDRDVKGEGKDMLTRINYILGTIITRPKDKSFEEAPT